MPSFEVFRELTRGQEASSRLSLEAMGANRFQVPINSWNNGSQSRCRFLSCLIKNRQDVLSQEWRSSRKQIK